MQELPVYFSLTLIIKPFLITSINGPILACLLIAYIAKCNGGLLHVYEHLGKVSFINL